jgi:hypothetical protein
MILKRHKNLGRVVIALCDSEIIGKKFVEGEKRLDLSSQFYNGQEMVEENIKREIRGAYIINAVGKKSIEFLARFGISPRVLKVDNVPYTQVLLED